MRHKWESPEDWLGAKINTLDTKYREDPLCNAADVIAELMIIANTIVNGTLNVNADDIQGAFQDEMDEDGYFRDLDICNSLDRETCVRLLEGVSIECFSDETVETLREAVQSNIDDGTLDYDLVASEVAGG